jgi:hypothetical protein
MIVWAWLLLLLALIFVFMSFFFIAFLYIFIPLAGLFLLLGVFVILFSSNPPSNISVTRGNTVASVEFTHVPHATSYQVTSHPGGRTALGKESPLLVSGLINNIAYTFTVKAITSRGIVESKHSTPIIPEEHTTAPVSINAIAGDQEATISFVPTDHGKASKYTVMSIPGNIMESGSSSPIVLKGLTNGVSYHFTVRASNELGEFEDSIPSNKISPHPPLYKPKQVRAAPMNESALVSFITSHEPMEYTVTAQPGNHIAKGKTSPIKVNGLTNGIDYTFSVTSHSLYGNSETSFSVPVIPLRPPMAPTDAHIIAYGDGEAYIGFTSGYPYDPSISYTATSSSGHIGTSTISPILVTGLPKGRYSFSVTTTNTAGTSLPSPHTNEIDL